MAIEKRITSGGAVTYRVKVYYRKRVVASSTFHTKARAERWEREQKRKLDLGQPLGIEADRTTMGECLERYKREVSKKKRGHRQEAYIINRLMLHPLSHLPMSGVRGADVAALRDQLLDEGKSPSTVMKYLALLSHLFNTARREWGMESLANPVELVKKPTVRNARNRRLEPGEEERLLAACGEYGNPWIAPMVEFAVETAMRKGEILSLRWEHVDLEKRTAHLPETKNGEARMVPLSPHAIKVLRSLPRSIHGQVFCTSDYASRKAFIVACKRAGIEGLRFHDLRHEATSRLAERFGIHKLAKITGHKDTKMLLRYYHPRAEEMAAELAS